MLLHWGLLVWAPQGLDQGPNYLFPLYRQLFSALLDLIQFTLGVIAVRLVLQLTT